MGRVGLGLVRRAGLVGLPYLPPYQPYPPHAKQW
jgi:hypothetical protein